MPELPDGHARSCEPVLCLCEASLKLFRACALRLWGRPGSGAPLGRQSLKLI